MDLTMLLRQPPEVVAAMVVMEVVEVMVEKALLVLILYLMYPQPFQLQIIMRRS